jgi:hypothetical protein
MTDRQSEQAAVPSPEDFASAWASKCEELARETATVAALRAVLRHVVEAPEGDQRMLAMVVAQVVVQIDEARQDEAFMARLDQIRRNATPTSEAKKAAAPSVHDLAFEMAHDDVLTAWRVRNAALAVAATFVHPGPDHADMTARQALVREWVQDGHDQVEGENRKRTEMLQRMIRAERVVDALDSVLEQLACDHRGRLGMEVDPECARCESLDPLRVAYEAARTDRNVPGS